MCVYTHTLTHTHDTYMEKERERERKSVYARASAMGAFLVVWSDVGRETCQKLDCSGVRSGLHIPPQESNGLGPWL